MRKYELLLVPFVGWAIAQGIKYIISLRKDGLQWSDLYASGGFPSSHTALVVPVTTLLGLRSGLADPLFAVMCVVTGLVMYDAVGVRRSSGEQSLAIKELAQKTGKTLTTRMHGAKGHTPTEVIGGAVIGIAIGFAFYLFS
jgi:acid phosphatase family membrane protein YuiD